MDPSGIGIFLSLLVCILAILLYYAKSILRAILHFFLILFGIALLLPCISYAREAARRMVCSNNLKQIALALHNYQQAYRCFPPAYVADKDGKPIHSWRVLILPFMECEALYKQYDFSESWNGPNNRKLLGKRPREYVCFSDEKARKEGTTSTSYVAVVGANAAWHGQKPTMLSEIDSHGSESETILLIETADSGINWTEPKDLDVDALFVANRPAMQVKPTSRHMRSNGYFYHDTISAINIALVDGSVRSVDPRVFTDENLKVLLKIGGFSEDSIGLLTVKDQELMIHWQNVAALTVWLLSAVLLLHQAVRSRKARSAAVSASNP
jgi:hypothetical protein